MGAICNASGRSYCYDDIGKEFCGGIDMAVNPENPRHKVMAFENYLVGVPFLSRNKKTPEEIFKQYDYFYFQGYAEDALLKKPKMSSKQNKTNLRYIKALSKTKKITKKMGSLKKDYAGKRTKRRCIKDLERQEETNLRYIKALSKAQEICLAK